VKSKSNRRYYRPLLPIVVALIVGLTILSGYLQGKMSRRWGESVDILAMGRALESFPEQIGPWQLESSDKLEEPVEKVLECAGYLVRGYRNPETGETLNLALLLGPSGPMSVHSPDVCYSAQAYDRIDEPHQVTIAGKNGENGEFWAQTFEAKDVNGELLRVYYAWRAGGRWTAAKGARLSLAKHSYLYKVQVAAPILDAGSESDPAGRFLQDFLAVAQEELREL
jgi:hypothetical protein